MMTLNEIYRRLDQGIAPTEFRVAEDGYHIVVCYGDTAEPCEELAIGRRDRATSRFSELFEQVHGLDQGTLLKPFQRIDLSPGSPILPDFTGA